MKYLLLGLLIAGSVEAQTLKIPPLKLCMDNVTGALLSRKKCKVTETQLTVQALQGAQGTPGAPGTFDPAKCIAREASAGGSGVVIVDSPCLVAEIAVGMGCYSTAVDSLLMESSLFKGTNSLYPNLYGGASCIFQSAGSHTVTAQVTCCAP